MKTLIIRSELREALTGLGKIVPHRSTLPVLQAIRLETRDGTLTAAATDLDQSATYQFAESKIEHAGDPLVIRYEELRQLAKGGNRDVLVLEGDAARATIAHPAGEQSISQSLTTFPPEEWPTPPGAIDVEAVDAAFLDNVRTALPFASTDASRYILNGVCLDVGKGGHHAVATDGRRLIALNSVAFPLTETCVLPGSKFLSWKGLTGDVRVGASRQGGSSWFRIATPRWNYVVRAVDGTYPNWRQVVPEPTAQHRVTFHDKDVELLGRVLPSMPGHDLSDGPITVSCKANLVTVSARDENGSPPSVVELRDSAYAGSGIRFGVNRRYLLDALAAGFRAFDMTDERSALCARNDAGGVHVLMPLRVHDEPTKPKTKEKPMKNEPAAAAEPTALDRVLTAYETAKTKLREANEAMASIAVAVKESAREDRQRRAELESVRAGLAKLQAIRI